MIEHVIDRISDPLFRFDRCLTCGVTSHIPAKRDGEFIVAGPWCLGCKALAAKGRLPIHPWWCRTADDPEPRR